MLVDRMILRIEISLTGRPKAVLKSKISAARKRASKSEMGCDVIYEGGSVVRGEQNYTNRFIAELRHSNIQGSVLDNSIF